MSAAKFNLKIEQGATFMLKATWRDATGRPINLTGYTFKAQLRATVDASTVLVEFSTGNGRITTLPTLGVITLTLQDEDAAALSFTAAVWDLVAYAPDGSSSRLLEGIATLSPAVTR